MVSIVGICVLMLSLTTLPSGQSSTSAPVKDGDLIAKSCEQTEYPDTCVSDLRADPRSSNADVAGLAQIMLDLSVAKAKDILSRIRQLSTGTTDPVLKQYLDGCITQYNSAVPKFLSDAIADLQAKNYPFARTNAGYADTGALNCQSSFRGPPEQRKSPITGENEAMHEVAEISAALITILG
ncbi:hypothetical protein RJ639_037940 [Escallonia herrerae]|uniref:Pectinesterase inhibitor domain-containing protein n=1 Tax=Escallonia herrerae TaxID=1293975 RepID=A0AA89B7Q7_9ASTE|nr:hypothetical protein RJ639_037940 [Escallonia herrerae]